MTRRITVLGATGSIGDSTLDLIRRADAGTWDVIALTANTNAKKLAECALEFKPKFVALGDESRGEELKTLLQDTDIEIGLGRSAIIDAAKCETDFTMSAIIGAAGLEPTLAAIDQGIHVGLANKECLVCAGPLFMSRVKQKGATLLPVDSEHNAIFQALGSESKSGVRRLVLTASGGPFREKDATFLKTVTCEQALNHPTWSMGAKISIDSATLMNKGLELIEASYLFGYGSKDIDVIVHPQSIIHSMVEYVDGSVLAQLGSPDMRTPIAYVMGWPERMSAPVERLDFAKLGGLTFFEPDLELFPALKLARDALEAAGQAPNILNAANEIAVDAFLKGKIKFTDIPKTVSATLNAFKAESSFHVSPTSIDDVIETDARARAKTHAIIADL